MGSGRSSVGQGADFLQTGLTRVVIHRRYTESDRTNSWDSTRGRACPSPRSPPHKPRSHLSCESRSLCSLLRQGKHRVSPVDASFAMTVGDRKDGRGSFLFFLSLTDHIDRKELEKLSDCNDRSTGENHHLARSGGVEVFIVTCLQKE